MSAADRSGSRMIAFNGPALDIASRTTRNGSTERFGLPMKSPAADPDPVWNRVRPHPILTNRRPCAILGARNRPHVTDPASPVAAGAVHSGETAGQAAHPPAEGGVGL